MSRRGRQQPRAHRLSASAARLPARRARRRRGGWALAGAVALLAILAPMLARWNRPRAVPDPLASLSGLAAADSADRLKKAGRYIEALRFIRHLSRLMTRPDPGFDAQVAIAEHNATIEVRSAGGLVIPATRSSVERIALLRDAFERLDHGSGLTTDGRERNSLQLTRAGILAVWGFARESYGLYQRAHEVAPLDAQAQGEALWLQQMLLDPTVDLAEPAAP